MAEVKILRIGQKFKEAEDLYNYLLKNVEFISKSIRVQIQKPLKEKLFCLTGKEKITERSIIFFASKNEFPENLGELIILAGAFDVTIIVFFIQKANVTHLESLNWLQNIRNDDT